MMRASPFRLLLISFLIVLVLDRLTKLFILEIIDLDNALRVEVFPPFLNFVMAWNTGVNFGLGAGGPDAMRWILTGVAVAISIGLFWWVMRRSEAALCIGAGIVIGGALGNAWDRIQYGAVADFLNMSCCGIDNPFAFNVADCAIFVGAVIIAWKA